MQQDMGIYMVHHDVLVTTDSLSLPNRTICPGNCHAVSRIIHWNELPAAHQDPPTNFYFVLLQNLSVQGTLEFHSLSIFEVCFQGVAETFGVFHKLLFLVLQGLHTTQNI